MGFVQQAHFYALQPNLLTLSFGLQVVLMWSRVLLTAFFPNATSLPGRSKITVVELMPTSERLVDWYVSYGMLLCERSRNDEQSYTLSSIQRRFLSPVRPALTQGRASFLIATSRSSWKETLSTRTVEEPTQNWESSVEFFVSARSGCEVHMCSKIIG